MAFTLETKVKSSYYPCNMCFIGCLHMISITINITRNCLMNQQLRLK